MSLSLKAEIFFLNQYQLSSQHTLNQVVYNINSLLYYNVIQRQRCNSASRNYLRGQITILSENLVVEYKGRPKKKAWINVHISKYRYTYLRTTQNITVLPVLFKQLISTHKNLHFLKKSHKLVLPGELNWQSSNCGIYDLYVEKGMAIYSGILGWRIPWTQEPGGLQPMRSQRFRHG